MYHYYYNLLPCSLTFKNKVKLNISQSYCSWVFNWSLLLLLLFSLSYFYLFIFVLFFWPIICFAQALVPTYVIYLNIIYFYSARLAFQLFWVNVTFFVLICYACKLSLTSKFGNKACCLIAYNISLEVQSIVALISSISSKIYYGSIHAI